MMSRRKFVNSMASLSVLGSTVYILDSCGNSVQKIDRLLFLTDQQAQQVKVISDIYIPKTDIPSASEIGVHLLIDAMLHYMPQENQSELFVQGLKVIDLLANQRFSLAFLNLTGVQQTQMFEELSIQARNVGSNQYRLFHQLRDIIVRAYFQSEYVSKQVLKYDPIPGEYRGCVPFDEIGGQWTL